MSTLWFLIGAAMVGAVTFVALRGTRLRAADEPSADAVFAQRRAELTQDLADGTLKPEDRLALEEELARLAVREIRPALTEPATAPRGHRIVALLGLFGVVAAIAVPVYLHLGMPGFASGSVTAEGPGNHPSPAQMLEELNKRVAAAPDDPEPHMWLARVHMAARSYGKAVDEFEIVLKLAGEVPGVLVQYADALAMLNGGRLSGRPAELVQRALAVEPGNPTALWLAGLAAEEAGKPDEALGYLQRARVAALAAEQPIEELDKQIAALGGKPGAAPSPAADAASGGPRLTVKVELDPALAAKVGPGATLFVLARRPAGMPMPLAVKRLSAAELPVTVVLDDSLAMAPTARLSSATEVDVIARISQQGQPVAASGDLEGKQAGVAVGGDVPVAITIDRILP